MLNLEVDETVSPNIPKSPIMISSYSHKGGVGKTTSVFNLAHLLAYELGYNVLIVDADPQCSLTSMAVRKNYISSTGSISDSNIQRYITENYQNKNIFALIQPICQINQKNTADTVQKEIEDNLENCEFVVKNPYLNEDESQNSQLSGNLFLLPGNNRLFEFENIISNSFNKSDTVYNGVAALLPYAIRKVAKKHQVDIILVDCNPGSTLVIASLLNGSDYFMVPVMPDHYSHQAIWSLSHIIPEWTKTLNQDVVPRNVGLREGNPRRFPEKMPKFLGLIQQRVKTRYSNKEQKEEIFTAYDAWLKRIYRELNSSFKPSLRDASLAQPLIESGCLDYPEYIIPIINGVNLSEDDKSLPIVALKMLANSNSQTILAKLKAYRKCYINVLFSLFENMSNEHKIGINLPQHVEASKDEEIQQHYALHLTLTEQKKARSISTTGYYNHPIPVIGQSLEKFLVEMVKDTEMRKAVIRDLMATPLAILKQSTLMENTEFREFSKTLEESNEYKQLLQIELSQSANLDDDDNALDTVLDDITPNDLIKSHETNRDQVQSLALKKHGIVEDAIKYFLSDAAHYSVEVLNCHGGLLDYLEKTLNVKIEIFKERHGASINNTQPIRPRVQPVSNEMAELQGSNHRFIVLMTEEGKFRIEQDSLDIAKKIHYPDTVASRTSMASLNLAEQEDARWCSLTEISKKSSKQREGKVIAMFNYKGGVGKTTTTHNLSVMLSRQGYRVLVIDADTQCSLSSVMMGDDYYLYNLWSKMNSKTPQIVKIKSQQEEGGEKSKDLTIRRDIISCYYDILQGNIIGQLREALDIRNSDAEKNYLETLRFFKTNEAQAGVYILPADITHHVPVECQLITLLRNKRPTDQSNLKFALKLIKLISTQFDFVFVDMSPSPSATNSLFFLGCSYLMIPTGADYLSCQSVRSLPGIFQDWLLKYSEFFIENLIKSESKNINTNKIDEFCTNLVTILGLPQLIQVVPNRFPLKAESVRVSKWDTHTERERKEDLNTTNFLMRPQDESFSFIAEITQFMYLSYKTALVASIHFIKDFKELLELKAVNEAQYTEFVARIETLLLQIVDKATKHSTLGSLSCVQGIPDHNSLGLQLQSAYIPIAMATVIATPNSIKSKEFEKAKRKYNFAYTELACDLILKTQIDFIPLHFYFHQIHRWCIRFFNIDFVKCFNKADSDKLHEHIQEISMKLYAWHQVILTPKYQILTGLNYTSGYNLRDKRAIIFDNGRSVDLSTIGHAIGLLQDTISGKQVKNSNDAEQFITVSQQLLHNIQDDLQPHFEAMEELMGDMPEPLPNVFGTLTHPTRPQQILPAYQSEVHKSLDIYRRYCRDIVQWIQNANKAAKIENNKRKAATLPNNNSNNNNDNDDDNDETSQPGQDHQTSSTSTRQKRGKHPRLLFEEVPATTIKTEPEDEQDHRANIMAQDDDDDSDNPWNQDNRAQTPQ